MAARPLPPTGTESGKPPGTLQAWQFKADMARSKSIDFFMRHSGDLAHTTEIHRALRSGLFAMQESGFDCGPLLTLLDEASRLSPDQEGKSRKEILQLLEESPLIIPGVGATGIRQPDEIGRIEHAKRMIFGEPKGGS
jgi:hypothetical protein